VRIAVVAPDIPIPGAHGGSTHVTELVRALRKRHEVLPVVRRGSTEPGSVAIGLGGGKGLEPYLHWALAFGRVRRFAPDAIYERFSANGLGVLLARALGVPVVSMVLDPHVTRLTLRGADRLITTAPQLVPREYHGKLIEVAWGANIEHFRPDIDGRPVRRELGIADDEYILGYAGAFYSWHGLETLVAAVDASGGSLGNVGFDSCSWVTASERPPWTPTSRPEASVTSSFEPVACRTRRCRVTLPPATGASRRTILEISAICANGACSSIR
jgi:glycosyltransferase involved in cell wall biosynthesis